VSCLAVVAFLILVSISAIGSLIDIYKNLLSLITSWLFLLPGFDLYTLTHGNKYGIFQTFLNMHAVFRIFYSDYTPEYCI
jgi:hypothetical protein